MGIYCLSDNNVPLWAYIAFQTIMCPFGHILRRRLLSLKALWGRRENNVPFGFQTEKQGTEMLLSYPEGAYICPKGRLAVSHFVG